MRFRTGAQAAQDIQPRRKQVRFQEFIPSYAPYAGAAFLAVNNRRSSQ